MPQVTCKWDELGRFNCMSYALTSLFSTPNCLANSVTVRLTVKKSKLSPASS